MNASVFLDDDLAGEVKKTSSLVGKDQATVLQMAIRAGLPAVAQGFQAQPPPGYFNSAYLEPDPEREALEEAMGRQPQTPER